MNSSGIKIRWITTTCFEIVLPNGKVIILDPWVGKEHPMHPGVSVDTGFSVDDFTGADYIFLSHTHFDHIADLMELLDKKQTDPCGGHVFLPALSAKLFSDVYDVPLVNLIPVYPYETFELDDIIVTPLPCRHFGDKGVNVAERPGECRQKAAARGEDLRYHESMEMGSLEEMDLAITVKSCNFRFMVLGGRVYRFQNIYKWAEEFHPDFVIRQVSNGFTPEDYADIVKRFHAPVVFPSHHDLHHLELAQNMSYEAYFGRVNQLLKEEKSSVRVVNIKPCTWYQVGTVCQEANAE